MQKKSLFFRRFPQGEKGELQPIEWFVLKEENENKLLISKYALLCRAFHKGYNSCWETCDLRQYLNSEFYDIAFDQSEKERIVKAKLKSYIFNFNPISNIFDNYQEPAQEELYNTFLQFIEMAENPTCETEDRVFLLSADEVYEYFYDSADEEKCRQTQYARSLDNVDASYSSADYCSWWLRSGFGSSVSAPNATHDNKLREVGTYTDNWHDEHPIFYGVCVRPAIIIKD